MRARSSAASTDSVAWATGPDRDEAGSPNVVGAVALAAAVQALQGIGMDVVADHESELTEHALRRLAPIPAVTVHGDADPGHAAQRLGVITFNVEGLPHGLVAAALSTEYGVAVRSGCFCAHPYLARRRAGSPISRRSSRCARRAEGRSPQSGWRAARRAHVLQEGRRRECRFPHPPLRGAS